MKGRMNNLYSKGNICLCILVGVLMVAILVLSAGIASSVVYAESNGDSNDLVTEEGSLQDLYDVNTESTDSNENIYTDEKTEKIEASVMFEDTSRRTTTEKHFKLSDGSYVANIFSYDIHYLEGDKYEEIDNRLIKDKDGKYKNQKNKLKVELSESYENGAKSKVSVGDYSIAFRLLKQEISREKVVKVDNIVDSKEIKAGNEFKYDVNAQSTMRYYFADKNIELEHNLIGTSLKENIIVNKPLKDYIFEYEIEANNLKLVLTESGDIEALDKSGKSILTIPKGYMFDSAGARSNDVDYKLEKKDGKYLLYVVPDAKWMNDGARVFPITIDPTVSLSNDGTGFKSVSTGTIENGEMPASDTVFSFLDFNFPEILKSSVILRAYMILSIKTYANNAILQVWENPNEFTDAAPTNAKITYEGRNIYRNYYYNPSNAISPYAKQTITGTMLWPYVFDITESIKNKLDFEKIDDFHGFAFNTVNANDVLIANEEASVSSNRPMLTIYYRNMVGLESYWDYDSYSIGNNDVYINTYNDEATVLHTDAAFEVDTPVVLQHVYMDRYCDESFNVDNVFANFNLGYGWKLNYQQIIRSRGSEYEYYDEDGTLHFFRQNSATNTVEDEDGLGLKLYTVGSNKKMVDANDNEKWFDQQGRLFKTLDKKTNGIVNIVYGNGNQGSTSGLKITQINDNNSHAILLNYNGSGFLTSVTYKRSDGSTTATVSFEYSDNKLSKITNDNGTYSQYVYDGLLQQISIENGYTLKLLTDRTGVTSFGLTNVHNDFEPSTAKVRSVWHGFNQDFVHLKDNVYCHGLTIGVTAKYGEPYVGFNSIDVYYEMVESDYNAYVNSLSPLMQILLALTLPFVYIEYRYIDVAPYMASCENYFVNNYRIRNSYDACGRLVSTCVDDCSTMTTDVVYDFLDEGNTNINNNKPVESISYISNTITYGRNMSFENNVSYWTFTNSSNPYKVAQLNSQYAAHGKRSLEMFVATPSSFWVEQSQGAELVSTGKYTVSGSIRVENLLISGVSGNGYGAYIYLKDELGNICGRSEYVKSPISAEDNGFIDVSFECELDASSIVKVGLGMKDCAGIVYFDKIQFAYTPYGENETFNNAVDGSFIYGTEWRFTHNNNLSNTPLLVGGAGRNYAELQNNGLGKTTGIYQKAAIENNADLTVYGISAWLKRSGKYYTFGNDAHIGLKYRLLDKDEHTLTEYVSKEIELIFDCWYKLSVCFSVPSSAKYVEINIEIKDIEGTILVDNVSLVKCKVSRYEYDSNGNNSKYSTENNEYTYIEAGNEANIAINGVNRYIVRKNNNGNVTYSEDLVRKVKTSYIYDEKGRETSSSFSSSDNSYKIATATSYSSISNNLIDVVTTTDSLGFQTISNAYAYSGLLKKTTFNDGTYVEYDYGSGGFSALPATITVRSKNASGTTLTSTVYNYFTMTDLTNSSDPKTIHVGSLKSVNMPNGTIYSYEYDKWGNILIVKLNGTSQITYIYDNEGVLLSKTLANGYAELYTYDALCRMIRIEEKVNNSTVNRYSYEYSVTGDLIATYDELNNYCYKKNAFSADRASYSIQGNYQTVGAGKVCDFEYINEVRYDVNGSVQKNIGIEANAPSFYIACTASSYSGAMARIRNGLTETLTINGTTQITYTYNSPSTEYGRILVEDNKLIKNSTYPNGVRFVYTRDLDGNITSIKVSQYGTNANAVTYNSPYCFHTESYEFDNAYVNLWDFDWMQKNKPSGSSAITKMPDEEYNGTIIKDIIKLHHNSFKYNNYYYSLVDTAALKSGVKNDTITFWARLLSVPSGSPTVYVPCLVYSDGTHSTYQTLALNTNWQLFSITVNKTKTAVALQLPQGSAQWLEIGNMNICVEKTAWDINWALNNVANQAYASQALPQERISDSNYVSGIIKAHANTYFVGTQGGTEVYRSLINPDLLTNGGDCITLTYRIRLDALDSNLVNNYTQTELNSMVCGLRFRYSDNSISYGANQYITYSTSWQTYSITSTAGKKVIGVELGKGIISDWLRIGDIRISVLNLGRLDDRIAGQTLYNNDYVSYAYDPLGRETGIEVKSQKHAAASILAETYSYLNGTVSGGVTNTSYMVTSKAITYGSNSGITYNYTYCMDNSALGSTKTQRSNPYNIWQIKEGSTVKVTYNYDLLGRLIREDNAYVNATITYTYDSNNNLLSKTNYAYSPGTATGNLTGGSTKSYTYGNTTYKDRLTSYNGQSISYDSFGNPTSYRGKTLTWQGRKLASLVSGGVTKSFTYDANGIRKTKTVGSTVTEYLYNGTQLLKETKGSDVIYYLYEQTGMIGFELNGTPYYYVRNLQGDVTKIIDGSGNVVVQYAYDSWGKVLSVTGSLASTVGAKNPIRYRGYYYDTETELYYLNSRYYDPETGRFISPDVVAEGGNLYTYCQNDPVNRSDDSGYLSGAWKARLMKIAAGTVFAIGAVAVTIMTGGAALPVIAGIVGGAALSGAIGGTIALIQGNDGKEAIIDGLVDGFMWSGFFSAASATISSVVKTRSAVVKTSPAGKSVEPIQTGNVKVYHAVEGEKHYYGITNNLSRRAAEHARNGRTIIESLNGSYTRAEARGIEQFLINRGGGPKSLLLTNKINSIAPSNPNYIKMVNTGKSLFNTSCWVPFE